MTYTLGTAAKATGTSKATIHRAIKSGKVSATRNDNGSYTIDPAELHRVFPPVSSETGDANGAVRQLVTPSGTHETPHVAGVDAHQAAVKTAQLEAEISGLKELVRVYREQSEDLRSERDRLLGQVEAAHRLLTHQQTTVTPVEAKKRFRWWGLRTA